MKIKKVEIINYKSIKNISIPFQEYGENSKKSKASFLVGLNETGKSAILEALNFIDKTFNNIDYEEICYKGSLDNDEYVELYIDFDIETSSYWEKQIIQQCDIPKLLAKKILFNNVKRNIYINDEEKSNENYEVNIKDIDFHHYLVENDRVYNIREKNKITKKITKSNFQTFINLDQNPLTKSFLEEKLKIGLSKIFDVNLPKVQIWKPQREYLINEDIDLLKFKENTSISIPLKNIFHICGYDNDAEIKKVINRALGKQEKCDELKDNMSNQITTHLNKIWVEHKVKVVISINGNNCCVFIEDKDRKHNYFKMDQRSEGFKQFISLILSLSALNDTNKLKNRIILIDEPEVHLHPSGVRYMRDEILKIGKNNYIFASTHSHYMVDTNCPERHWIVKKEKTETYINQIDSNTPVESDDVLLSAFGINFFKELLPQNILIVEGGGDMHLLNHVFRKYKINNYSIKSAGGASKMPTMASMLAQENIKSYFLFDDDKEGKENKNKLIKISKNIYSNSNVFTLRDLVSILPENSTIEDLMPIEFVVDFFNKELDQEFEIENNKAIILQFKNKDNRLKDKQKLDSLKTKLSQRFIEKFKTSAKITKDAPLLNELKNNILNRWD
ncbi:AAA family ATPase [uncultured Lacinutrix sp.]|uniref:ATP-dependent nuclease n=1 Tax=uncultured Lacinutrix sp. TaxID=574032 RepID=UPI002631BC66|nr:AAA family ATPase [uncultured Lacinutrix sp.]